MTNLRPEDDPVEYDEDEELAVLSDDLEDADLDIVLDDERLIDEAEYEPDDDILPDDL